MKLLSEKGKSRFITSKTANLIFMVMLFSVVMFCVPVYADALEDAKSLLAKACTVGGGLWAAWGLVQLGISIKDHNGPGIQGAIWQLIGGAIIIAAGTTIGGLDLDLSKATATNG